MSSLRLRASGKSHALWNRPFVLSACDRHLEIRHHHLGRNLHRRGNRHNHQHSRCCGFGYTTQSHDYAVNPHCARPDRARASSTYRGPSDSPRKIVDLLVRRLLVASVRSAVRDRSSCCRARNRYLCRAQSRHFYRAQSHLSARVATPDSNFRCPICSSCRCHRDGRHFHRGPRKRCRLSCRQSRGRPVRDEKSSIRRRRV